MVKKYSHNSTVNLKVPKFLFGASKILVKEKQPLSWILDLRRQEWKQESKIKIENGAGSRVNFKTNKLLSLCCKLKEWSEKVIASLAN